MAGLTITAGEALVSRALGLVAEQADAPDSNSGDHGHAGSTPAGATHRHRPDLTIVLSTRGFRGAVLTTHPCVEPGCDFQMERA